ncbi:hypothetical protein [uncultured Bifidobacterium sp.]|nr:hypothetical protein [uncultured Bifidobacterium sp.]
MSVKGCSLDNADPEEFFDHPKQELFHKKSFTGVSVGEFIDMPDEHMV